MDIKLDGMGEEAGNHQRKLEQLVQKLSDSLDSSKIHEAAQETEQKASEIMKTYLGEEPDSSEAIEFLCLAEGGEVTHYKVLSALATKKVKNKQFSNIVNSILREEKDIFYYVPDWLNRVQCHKNVFYNCIYLFIFIIGDM